MSLIRCLAVSKLGALHCLKVLRFTIFLLPLSLPITALAQGKTALEYLPKNTLLDDSVPSPESVLGFNVGEWHVRHDQLVQYMYALADASDRVSIEVSGYTHERRPLLLLTITDPTNRSKLEPWREAHLSQLSQGTTAVDDAPLFLYMGYSVHGNEPSGANASLLVAYYLAAAKDQRVTELLRNNVVLLDPSFNPDGLSRFAQWANMHKGQVLSADPEHREHQEGWPNGRTNHYWFDLNRDWLMLVHPESQARIEKFQHWRPHVLTDFHEMGTNSSYFFQPGVPSRKHPLTPEGNVRLTEALAKSFVNAFDAQKQLYFSQEGFDDFYYGKGSTYPDAQGGIGILFEQASSRGHLQSSVNGPLAFSQTIQNQLTMSLAVFDGAMINKSAILDYQNTFYRYSKKLIKDDKTAGYLISEPSDNWRLKQAKWVLSQHNIRYQTPAKTVIIDNQSFAPETSIVVPVDQPQYRLVKSLFSTQKKFTDNTFYDVSNWNLPLAFNLAYKALSAKELKRAKLQNEDPTPSLQYIGIDEEAYAYAFEWQHYKAPALLRRLLSAGVNARIATQPFNARIAEGNKAFTAGTIVVPMGIPQPPQLINTLKQASQREEVPVFSLTSGSTSSGLDLGSRSMVPVQAPKVLVVGGLGTSPYRVGEIWHYLDTQVGLPITLVDQDRLDRIVLANYTHVVFAAGQFNVNAGLSQKIREWVQQGGTLIGQTSALRLFSRESWLDIEVTNNGDIADLFKQNGLKYGDKSAFSAQQLVAGAVYNMAIDTTHPLFFGYDETTMPVFKTNNMIVSSSQSPFAVPARYAKKPLLAGFSADIVAEEIEGSVAVIAQSNGKGRVIGFTDNTQFRGYWYGTHKLLSNALFLSAAIN